MKLRPATPNDGPLLLQWRNDPETRRNSLNAGLVLSEEHTAWLTATLASPARKLMIAEVKGEPIGTVRADYHEEGAELSWAVAPKHRGRGLGKQMVSLFMQSAHPAGMNTFAKIKEGNQASARIAQAAGMRLKYTQNGLMHWERYG